MQAHHQAVKSFLERVDGQRASRVRQRTWPVVVSGVRVGGALERVEHALLPRGAFELQPFVPVGGLAQVEALQEGPAPERDRPIQLAPRGAWSAQLEKGGDVGPHRMGHVGAPH